MYRAHYHISVSQIKITCEILFFPKAFFPPPPLPGYTDPLYFPGCFASIRPLLSCPSKMGE